MSSEVTTLVSFLVVPNTSEHRIDAKFTRQLIEAFSQRGRYGNAPREPLHPLVMALLPWKPDAFDAGQTPGFPDGAHCRIDIAFEYLNRAERIDSHRQNRLAGVRGGVRMLDE